VLVIVYPIYPTEPLFNCDIFGLSVQNVSSEELTMCCHFVNDQSFKMAGHI